MAPTAKSQLAGVALVTGSGSPRVGRSIALHLASLGYTVALHANHSTREAQQTVDQLRDQNSDAIAVQADLREPDQIQAMVDRVVQHFGRIDVLVNSAAIWYPTRLEDVTPEEMRKYFDINAIGTFIAARAAGLVMVGQPEGGAIINIGDWALERPYLDHAAYFPSKAAVESITRTLAVELAERNRRIRVNCILPGPVLLAPEMDEEKRSAVQSSTLLKRVGTPEHIAHAVQFLIENDFVTGVCLPVDGGRTIYADDRLQTHFRTG
jgi:NAD(P)-dependent dehydrogenase (short-subunit alcohol dehydrogenase family)